MVELLVVVAIIALLLGILLPAINKARQIARNVVCTSNVRQLSTAAVSFTADHDGFVQTVSDHSWMGAAPGANGNGIADRGRNRFDYREDGYLKDWVSALIPYLGGDYDQDFQTAPDKQGKIFRCPTDPSMRTSDPGYRIFNNVAVTGNQPVSYGVNADIAAVSDRSGIGRFGKSDEMNVYAGPSPAGRGKPMNAKLTKVFSPSNTLLYADCGTRPTMSGAQAPLDQNDSLYYTSNWMSANSSLEDGEKGTLAGLFKTDWLSPRVPVEHVTGPGTGRFQVGADQDRHNKSINIAFADGHGASVSEGGFISVRVSPWEF